MTATVGTVVPLVPQREQVVRTPVRGTTPALLGNSTGVLYTAPTLTSVPTGSAGTALLKSLVICNTDSSSRTYTITIGGTTAAYSIFSGATIAANTTHTHVFPDDTFILSDGETINGFASAASVVAVRINIVQLTY